jgi:hypothetical protein
VPFANRGIQPPLDQLKTGLRGAIPRTSNDLPATTRFSPSLQFVPTPGGGKLKLKAS